MVMCLYVVVVSVCLTDLYLCVRPPGDFKLQPEPSLVLSQLAQRHGAPSLPIARQPSPPPAQSPSPIQGPPLAPIGAKPAPSAGPDPQGSNSLQQHRVPQLKAQKRRIPPTSKVKGTVDKYFLDSLCEVKESRTGGIKERIGLHPVCRTGMVNFGYQGSCFRPVQTHLIDLIKVLMLNW